MEAAQGRAPCSACGTVNPPFVNPYGPQMGAQWPTTFGTAAPGAQPWSCASCRHQNEAHYEFCLGCGAGRLQRGSERGEGREGYEGNPAEARRRSPVLLIVLAVTITVAAAIVGVAVRMLAR